MNKLLCNVVFSASSAFSMAVISAPAYAASIPVTWVSSAGHDTAACTRAAPCATFAGALAKTSPAGTVGCVDSGSFGPMVIKQSVKIDCVGVQAEINAPSGVGVTISTAATDGVLITGLSIQGDRTGSAGIKITSGAGVSVFQTRVNGFATGVLVAPTGASVSMKIAGSVIGGNGTGLYVNSTAAGAGNSAGVSIDNSVVAANVSFGVRLTSSNALAGVTADTSKIEANGTGISAEGPVTGIILRNSNVTVNGTGIASSGGAVVQSTGNNLIMLNTSAGVTPSIVPQE